MKSGTIITIMLMMLIAVFGLLGGRLFYLQHCRSEYYQQNYKRQQRTTIVQTPQRGLIVDRNGRILAASNRIDTVFAEPRAMGDTDAVKEASGRLQEILGFPGHEICGIIQQSKNPGFAGIKTAITPEQCMAVKSARIRGVGIQSNWQRYYPMGPLTCHLVGFAGVEQFGLSGIELEYDSVLCGKSGQNTLFVDVSRRPIGIADEVSFLVEDGSGLVLTVDTTIQQFARAALVKQMKAYQAESAVAIVMDPWTGGILAMVSLPDFDPAGLASSHTENLRNRALTDPFEPGSIFKPIAAAVALDCGAINYDEKIFCENGDYRGRGFGKIGEYGNHQFADLNVRQILVESSNIGMAKIGQRIGAKRLCEGIKLFGFGKKTGIDLPGEDAGMVHPLPKWNGYSVTRVPFGHEITVTALQITRAYATLANGGRFISPHLFQATVAGTGRVSRVQQPPSPAGYIVKPKVAHWIVRQALTAVVTEGTGKKAGLDNVRVFGKTGTANISVSKQIGYDQANYVASFVGGAPAENPSVVILVSIRKPNRKLGKGYTGGTVAAPVFREILEKTLTYLQHG